MSLGVWILMDSEKVSIGVSLRVVSLALLTKSIRDAIDALKAQTHNLFLTFCTMPVLVSSLFARLFGHLDV